MQKKLKSGRVLQIFHISP